MDSNTARWMQILRFDSGQLQAIHAEELACYNGRGRGYARESWRFASHHLFERFNSDLGPFWDKAKPDNEREDITRSVEAACRKIAYPFLMSPKLNEIEAQHAADGAIWRKADEISMDRNAGPKRSPELERLYSKGRQAAHPYQD